jgi:hypothetical protein
LPPLLAHTTGRTGHVSGGSWNKHPFFATWARFRLYGCTWRVCSHLKTAQLNLSNNPYIYHPKLKNMDDHKIISFEDAELGTIWIEVSSESGMPTQGTSKVGGGATTPKFDDALATVRGIAGKIIGQITTLPNQPDEVECKIGIKFNAEAGVVLAKVSSEGNLELTLKWKNEKKPS